MKAKGSAEVIKLQPPLQYAEPTPSETQLGDDDIAWATRSGMWRTRVEKASARRTKRAKPAPALTLAGHGVSLRIVGGALPSKTDLPIMPQRRETFRYVRATHHCLSGIILLDGSGSITFDVLSWLAEQKIGPHSN